MSGLLVLAILPPDELVPGLLMLRVHLLEVIASGVTMPKLLVPLSTWEYTCNFFKSRK